MSQNVTKNQHYVPQGILSNFSNDKDMTFEANVENMKLYKTNIRNAMSKRYMYEHEAFETNAIEHFFVEYESELKINTTNIISYLECYNKSSESYKELKKMISNSMILFLMMYYRSNALFEEYNFADKLINKKSKDSIFEMVKMLSSGTYLNDLANTICNNYCLCILASDNNFLISDQFISTCSLNIKNRFFGMSNRQIGMKDILILIPLSSKYYICCYHCSDKLISFKEGMNVLSEYELTDINKVIINNSYDKCCCLKGTPLENALKLFKWQSPAQITAGFNNRPTMGATIKKEIFYLEKDKKNWDFFLNPTWMKYKNLGRNDICLCGSNKKFKKCCLNKYTVAERMMNDIINNDNGSKYLFKNSIIEKGISEFNM